MKFKSGQLVEYKGYVGKIRFICNTSLTICNPGLQFDCCVVVYHSEWNLINEIPSDL